jgi:small-conductance mechanosensitive channel
MMTKICPACSAELPNTSTVCEYCGSSIIPLALSVLDHKRINTFAQELNNRLVQEKQHTTRTTFSLFTLIVLILFFSLIALYYIYKFTLLNLILFSLVVIFLAYFISVTINRRKVIKAFHKTFQEKINPDLNDFLNHEGMPRWQFDQIAQQALKPGAPLKRFLLGDETIKVRNGGR